MIRKIIPPFYATTTGNLLRQLSNRSSNGVAWRASRRFQSTRLATVQAQPQYPPNDASSHAFSSDHADRPDFARKPKITVDNEPQQDFMPNSDARHSLEAALQKYTSSITDVPIIIGDEEIRSEQNVRYHVAPYDHSHKVAKFYHATGQQIEFAIEVALAARRDWERTPQEVRAEIFLRAADLLSTKYRWDLLATTMIGQGKNVLQAEIDAACELIDFLRFNAKFALDLYDYQPTSLRSKHLHSTNSIRYRGLEGFVAAISPFNFTAIGGNLAFAPALMGNVVVWKPSDTAVLSNYVVYKAMREAGIPAGVVNFLPSSGPTFGKEIVRHRELAGINFTGSVPTFRHLWKEVGKNLDTYATFPRLIGEVGGKNYHLIHPSADVETALNATIRAAFEYSGQKCSACSRLYIPASIWEAGGFRAKLTQAIEQIKVGSPLYDYETFMSAVIDEKSFDRIAKFIDEAKTDTDQVEIVAGGLCDKTRGYFVVPTVLHIKNPQHKLMQEEIFGPVLTVYVYPDQAGEDEILKLVDTTSPFGLTGAIFARDENYIEKATDVLRNSAGNFYINDKCTGAIVNQQPFGGARLSGTNDKAGGAHYLLRWASAQTIKQTRTPTTEWKYSYMKN